MLPWKHPVRCFSAQPAQAGDSRPTLQMPLSWVPPSPTQGTPTPNLFRAVHACRCMGIGAHVCFVLSSAQPLPAHKRHILGKKKKKKNVSFFPAFQLPELSGGMNGLGKISHRNKFTRDSWADKFSPQRGALRGLLAGDLPLVQSCLKRKTEQERGAFKSTPK